jgi:hypothetical protein
MGDQDSDGDLSFNRTLNLRAEAERFDGDQDAKVRTIGDGPIDVPPLEQYKALTVEMRPREKDNIVNLYPGGVEETFQQNADGDYEAIFKPKDMPGVSSLSVIVRKKDRYTLTFVFPETTMSILRGE